MTLALASPESSFHEMVAQPVYTHTCVEDQCGGIFCLDFDTDGIASVDLGPGMGRGHLSASAPDFNLQGKPLLKRELQTLGGGE